MDIRAADQLTTDGRRNGREQLTHAHDPSIQRGAADLEAGLPLQNRALTVQRQIVTIFGDHRVDHHPVTRQALVDDPRCERRRGDAAFLTERTRSFLALGHQHKVAGRFHIQLLASVIADHCCLLAAGSAGALFRCAGQHFLPPRQVRGQFLPARMFALVRFIRPGRFCFAFALRLDLYIAHARLPLQQLQLRVAQLLASRSILGDQLQTQSLFENLNF